MRKIKKKYKSYFDQNVEIKDHCENAKANLNLINYSRPKTSQTALFKMISAAVLVMLLMTSIFLVLTQNKSSQTSIPTARVTIDVNPSVELIVDQNNLVLAVNGLNDDGKLIIYDQEITGLDITKAIEKIIGLEIKYGYLTSIDTSDNKINVTIGTDNDEIKEELKKKIQDTIIPLSDKFKIKKTLQFVKEKTKAELIELALQYDSTITSSDVLNLSYPELLEIIVKARLETISLPTVQLEELYFKAKAYEIKLVENAYVKSIIDRLNISYQDKINEYDQLYNLFEDAIIKLEEVRYRVFVDETSEFQKTLKSLNDLKLEIASCIQEISQTEELEKKTKLNIELLRLTAEYKIKNGLLTIIQETVNEAINLAQDELNKRLENLEKFKSELPLEIKDILNNRLNELENNLNVAKDTFFKKFEEKYREKILQAIDDIKARIETLKR